MLPPQDVALPACVVPAKPLLPAIFLLSFVFDTYDQCVWGTQAAPLVFRVLPKLSFRFVCLCVALVLKAQKMPITFSKSRV